MGLISRGYHLVLLTSHFPFVGAVFTPEFVPTQQQTVSKGCLPRPCLAKRCWGPAVNANIPWSGPGTAHLGCRGVLDNAPGALGWFLLPQLKVSQE